ncbi:DUF1499 domain-containing protein [Woodsholea maritima]|uniref:DUF1499 domain-containing protein n=1 Tax=Woodsholea maritima TaxID=240237 RepID=UPI000370F948|nr:DUF1499 domain-containing protein [Woodsholea maritima]
MKALFSALRGLAITLAAFMVVFIPVWFASAALLTKGDFIDWQLGLLVLTQTFGPYILWAGLIVGVFSLIMIVAQRIVFRHPQTGWAIGVTAVVMALGGLGYGHWQGQALAAQPRLSDVTTDMVDPPYFTPSLVQRRGPEALPLTYEGKLDPVWQRPMAELQAQYYPDLGPLYVAADPRETFRAALWVARDLGWAVPSASETAMMFEATDESLWFGFEDDIVVRVTAHEGGSRVDARSVSRYLETDQGANVHRIERFFVALRANLSAEDAIATPAR